MKNLSDLQCLAISQEITSMWSLRDYVATAQIIEQLEY